MSKKGLRQKKESNTTIKVEIDYKKLAFEIVKAQEEAEKRKKREESNSDTSKKINAKKEICQTHKRVTRP